MPRETFHPAYMNIASPQQRIFLCCAAFICGGLLLLASQTVALSTAIGGLLILAAAALPIVIWFGGFDRSALPFLPYIGVYYAVFFGIPIFLTPFAFSIDGKVALYGRILLDTPRFEMLLLIAGGILALVASFLAARAVLFTRIPALKIAGASRSPSTLSCLYAILAAGSLAYRYWPALAGIPSIGQFLDPVGYLALGGFYLQWRAGQLPRWLGLLVLLVVVPLEIYWRVRTFFVSDLIFLALFLLLVLWRCRQFKLAAVIVTIGIICAGAYSVVITARVIGHTTFSGKIASFANVSKTVAEKGFTRLQWGIHEGYLGVSPLVNRIGQIWVFQTVYEKSPEQVPYWGGETYKPLLTSFIPRALYRDKPEERAGSAFGIRYDFITEEFNRTSINIPWIVELLANYGPAGVLIGMTLFGILLGFLDRVFNADGMGDVEFLVGLTLIYRLGYQESNFSVMTGSLLPLFAALYVYFRFGSAILNRLRR